MPGPRNGRNQRNGGNNQPYQRGNQNQRYQHYPQAPAPVTYYNEPYVGPTPSSHTASLTQSDVEALRDQAQHWKRTKQLDLAKKTWKSVTGGDLPEELFDTLEQVSAGGENGNLANVAMTAALAAHARGAVPTTTQTQPTAHQSPAVQPTQIPKAPVSTPLTTGAENQREVALDSAAEAQLGSMRNELEDLGKRLLKSDQANLQQFEKISTAFKERDEYTARMKTKLNTVQRSQRELAESMQKQQECTADISKRMSELDFGLKQREAKVELCESRLDTLQGKVGVLLTDTCQQTQDFEEQQHQLKHLQAATYELQQRTEYLKGNADHLQQRQGQAMDALEQVQGAVQQVAQQPRVVHNNRVLCVRSQHPPPTPPQAPSVHSTQSSDVAAMVAHSQNFQYELDQMCDSDPYGADNNLPYPRTPSPTPTAPLSDVEDRQLSLSLPEPHSSSPETTHASSPMHPQRLSTQTLRANRRTQYRENPTPTRRRGDHRCRGSNNALMGV